MVLKEELSLWLQLELKAILLAKVTFLLQQRLHVGEWREVSLYIILNKTCISHNISSHNGFRPFLAFIVLCKSAMFEHIAS